jgi:para-aminobenzoate synthetase component 1
MPQPAPTTITLHHQQRDLATTVSDAVVSFAKRRDAFILESACNTAGYGRYSMLGIQPVHRLRAEGDDPTTLRRAADRLRARTDVSVPESAADLPFVGGWVGCIPYEAAAIFGGVHPTPRSREPVAPLQFDLYDTIAVFDHDTSQWHFCGLELPESTLPAARRIENLTEFVQQAGVIAHHPLPVGAPSPAIPAPRPELTATDYCERVERAIAYIAAGDIYQVNLTQRFTADGRLDPAELYSRLRGANPADYAALIRTDATSILSASPELLLLSRRDGTVMTRPIKGTAQRGRNGPSDTAAREALRTSVKDRAELHMIVDLMRNDLGRWCQPGSVRVKADADIETHPTVHHLVATIAGRLRDPRQAVDLLLTSLPAGSITGCPKIRAMQIIDGLEPSPRGAYCGSIGYIGIDGTVGMNVAIRTITARANRLDIHAGGAITADSDPAAEYAETLAKAEGMFRALGHTTADLARAALDDPAPVE